jgi:hypothetical protein
MRGLLWIVWGNNAGVERALVRSQASASRWHPDLPQKVCRMPEGSDLRCKSQMYNLAVWETTLYLDADTVVMGKLDRAFDMAERHGMALCINPCPWARRYTSLSHLGDMTEYDTGLIAFSKRHAAVRTVFAQWMGGHDLDSTSYFQSGTGLARMPVNDQCAFAAAVSHTGFNPHVLPVNYNCHPKWTPLVFGPVRVWHDYNDPPATLDAWNAQQGREGDVIRLSSIEYKGASQ